MRWSLLGGLFALLSLSTVHAAQLGIPVHGGTHSGISVISGWKCDAVDLTVVFNNDGTHIPLLYGSSRPDVQAAGVCAHNHDLVGFVAIWNWNELDDGRHTAVVYDDGVAFARATFEVVTPGVPFLRDVFTEPHTFKLSNGQTATVDWSQAVQGFVVTDYSEPPSTGVGVGGTGVCASKESQSDRLRWVVRNPCEDGMRILIDLHANRNQYAFVSAVPMRIVQDGQSYYSGWRSSEKQPWGFRWRDLSTGRHFEQSNSDLTLQPGATAYTEIYIVTESEHPELFVHPDPPNFLEPYEIYWNDTLLFAFP